MRVGVDLDGVCYDFADSLRLHVAGARADRRELYPDPQRWEFYYDWGWSLEEFIRITDAGVGRGVVFAQGDPLPGCSWAFWQLREAGHSIHIVTDRSFGPAGEAAYATIRWLTQHELPFDSVTFSADKTIANVDVMVDDKPSNYLALKAAGVDAFLLTRPWNSEVQDAQRVTSISHFAEEVCHRY